MEEVERFQLELAPNGRLHGPILGPDHMVKTGRIPKYEVRIIDLAFRIRPRRKPVSTFALIRIYASGVSLIGIVRSHPKVIIDEAGGPLWEIIRIQR